MKKTIIFLLSMTPLWCTAQTYNQFKPGGDLQGTWNSQTIVSGAVTLAKQAPLAGSSIQGNSSSSATTPQALNPLAVANLMQAVIASRVASSTNIASLSGIQTIDGINGASGSIVLLTGQSTSSQNGLWVMASGAWTRPVNFPSGFVIAQNCNMEIFVDRGNTNGGKVFSLATLLASVTIDTSNQVWTNRAVASSDAASGPVVAAFNIAPVNNFDCASFYLNSPNYGVLDNGDALSNTGPCTVQDPNSGHVILDGTGTPPSPSAGSIATGSSDMHGQITGLVAATTVTLTFSAGFTLSDHVTARAAHCAANDSVASVVGVVPNVNGLTVVFNMVALTGTISYNCF